ncbi:ATP-binding protein [Pseudonocardia cypriaca]|uniref:SARP family transcriptional regulator n=1 Tax=Pseudonocardia cypriaca TaxID=882449 RepID=A0A543FUR8_9PSEU|nr:AAA family ATPase [Pseudonocardia cypriaca]TQM37570.1 SARP family transcriptional regulator [Pseudonocardia cypriaca]
MADQVRIQLLGTFRVLVGGEPVTEWPGRRSAELVQLLALADHHRLLRDQVLDALWPHLSPPQGAANLRKAAHHARQAIGRDDAVVLSGGGVYLFPSCRVETDVEEFERAAAAALRSGDAAACADATAAHPGCLLPGSLYEEWTQARRDHLAALHLDLLRAGGRWGRIAEVEPSDEQAHRELMREALANGNRHSAIRWYGKLRTHLERELGIRPGPETQALYDECVAGMARTATAYVGRQLELASATAALHAAERREVDALVVRGHAGMGKSALCRRVAAAARELGWTAVSVAARLGGEPYGPLVGAAEQLIGRDRSLLDALGAPARSTLAHLTPLAAPAPPRKGALTRHLVIGAVHRLLTARDATGVLLVLDDAHLADDATVDACLHLAHAGGRVPVLVLLAFRPESARQALTRAVAALDRAGRSTEIDLGPLDREDVVELARAGAPAAPADQALTHIVRTAHGNPFLVLELAGTVGPAGTLAVGRSVWDAVTARFLDLDDTSAAMLRRLAVAGDDLDPVDVPALTGLSEADAFELLDTALENGALTVTDGRYRFRHELVRQALIGQVPPHRRIAIHRETAGRLARAGAAPALVARHWLAGGRPDEAVGPLLAAARRAAGLGAFADALGHLEPLLEHSPGHGEALRLRAEALDALGDVRAPRAYAAAAAVGGPDVDEIRAKQALAQVKQGDPPGALRTLEGIEPGTVEGRLAHALALCGAAVLGFADPALGTAKAAECRRLALESGDATSLVIASWAQAAAAHARGDLRGSVWADLHDTHAIRALAISVFDGHLCISQRLLYGNRPDPDVIAFADSFAAEAQRLGAARGHAFAVTLRGEANLLSGQLDRAAADLTEAVRISRGIGAATGEALALQRRAEVALHRGCRTEASTLLDDALAVARDSDVGFHLLDRIYGTRITAAADPDAGLAALEEAEAAVRGPLETCPGCRITFAVPAAIAAARGGDLDRTVQYEQAAEMLATVVMRLPAWHAALAEVRGHRLRATGDRGATAQFRAAAEGFRQVGQPLDAARCAALL